MMRPDGSAISPRIPAIWATCPREPRAPESTMMRSGFVTCMLSMILSAMRRPASDQRISFWRMYSSSVRMPISYWLVRSSSCTSVTSSISFFSFGTMTSPTPRLMPLTVDQR